MQRRSFTQTGCDLASVHAEHIPFEVEDRNDETPVEVLVAALAQDAEPLQTSAQFRSFLPVLVRQRKPEFAIGEAQLKPFHHLRMRQAAGFEIPQRFRRFLQRLVIKAHDITQGLLLIGIERDR